MAIERQALMVVRMVGGSNAASLLQQGDILLAIDGRTVTHFAEVEHAVADAPTVKVTVWRADAAVQLTVETAALNGQDIDRVVQWAGATLQAPQRPIAAQRGIAPYGVYVAFFTYGSPSARYGLYPGRRIVEVDGVPTPDLDAFLKAVSGRPDRASLTTEDPELERCGRGHHPEARQALLPGLRGAAHPRRLGAAAAGVVGRATVSYEPRRAQRTDAAPKPW